MGQNPVETESSEIAKTKEIIKKVKQELEGYSKQLRAQQSEADKLAENARIEKLDQKVQKLLHGDPDEKGTGEKGTGNESFDAIASELAKTSGGKAYENLKSTYQDLIRLCISLCYLLAAMFRTEDRIAGGASYVANSIGWILSSVSGLLGQKVELHEDIAKASHCDNDGKVTVDPLPSTLFSKGMPPELINDLSKANEFLVHAFLLHHGYDQDAQGNYSRKKPDGTDEKLTSKQFESLKNDPQNGYKNFAEKYLPVKITKSPMGPAGTQLEAPEPLTPSSGPKP